MERENLRGLLIDGHLHCLNSRPGAVKRWADDRGCAAYAVLSLACTGEFGCEGVNNQECLRVKQEDPGRCFFFVGLTHPCRDYAAYLEDWLARGADGLKLIETKPTVAAETGIDLSDPRFDAMFALCEERRIPILWHVGDPAPFWREDAPAWARERGWYYGGGAYPSLEELYARAERVLARHPRLNVCFAHLYFCSDDMAHAQRLLDTYPNVRLDITPGTEMYTAFFAAPQRWREFFLRNAARIQLGSDSDFTADGEPLADAQVLALGALLDGPVAAYDFAAHGLALPDAVIKAICHDNFLSFAGRAAPAPIA